MGETRDISAGGISVMLSQSIDEDSSVDLALILTQDGIEDPNEDPFVTRANVMWAAPTDDGRAMIGLRFTGTVKGEQQRLERFLAALAENVAR